MHHRDDVSQVDSVSPGNAVNFSTAFITNNRFMAASFISSFAALVLLSDVIIQFVRKAYCFLQTNGFNTLTQCLRLVHVAFN